jgi:hypothetical protein
VVPLHSIEAHLGDRRYSSYPFLTSALEGGEWSASRPGRSLPRGKSPPVPIVQEAGWAPEQVWTQRLEEEILCLCRGSNPGRPVTVLTEVRNLQKQRRFLLCSTPNCSFHSYIYVHLHILHTCIYTYTHVRGLYFLSTLFSNTCRKHTTCR